MRFLLGLIAGGGLGVLTAIAIGRLPWRPGARSMSAGLQLDRELLHV